MGRPHGAASAIGQIRKHETMPHYEHVFLARQDLAQAQVDALAQQATQIVESNQGKVTKTENWGLRSLAYKIAKNRSEEHTSELQSLMRISYDVFCLKKKTEQH